MKKISLATLMFSLALSCRVEAAEIYVSQRTDAQRNIRTCGYLPDRNSYGKRNQQQVERLFI